MSAPNLLHLLRRARVKGQVALIPQRSYTRAPLLRPEFAEVIKALYSRPLRPSVMAVYEDAKLVRLARELSARDGQPVPPPRYGQV
jgi:hypothetical protein